MKRENSKDDKLFSLFLFCLFLFFQAGQAEDEIGLLIKDIINGPDVYYTPDAYSYYAAKGFSLPSQKSAEEVKKSFLAAIKLASKKDSAKGAIQALLDKYPRIIHVTEVRNVRYAGEGSFEDWVQTYVVGEKNKFVLSSPIFDYNLMSQVENFIVSSPEVIRISGEPVTIPTKDLVNIYITHTVYVGVYALSSITGQNLGTDHTIWLDWWNKNKSTQAPSTSSFLPPSPPSSGIRLRSGQSYDDIIVKGKYRISLSTGDILEGRIESKDNNSVVLETSSGKAYTFRPTLILRYEYLEPPPSKEESKIYGGDKIAGDIDTLPFAFTELLKKNIGKREIEVRLNNNMVFKGKVIELDSTGIKLKIGKSEIPISAELIIGVRFVPEVKPQSSEVEEKKSPDKSTIMDTVFVVNPKKDEWGRAGPDLIYIGTISVDKPEYLIITTPDSGEKRFSRSEIVRVIKKSSETYRSEIERYAKTLFCPPDMFLVDIPPGKEGRPFFKVCIDRYEYPNKKGTMPKVNVSYEEAASICKSIGKRLCTAEEWQWGCSGLEGYTYPYGWNPEKEKCAGGDNIPFEVSGSRHNCVSKFGGYDMVGNVFEWVISPSGQPAIMGGPYSKCQTLTSEPSGKPKPTVGFRCCKSN
ncbi:MAG: formylglycine-generating enzyme family protein [Chitinispirillaceae bacterium]|nr:formylglycine-generating enzyme family protein [Chitinispirillaceae bacterium]